MIIVTISREFGSGGRELGKRIAEVLGYDYYDRQIISTIAERHDMDEKFVDAALNSNLLQTIPLTFSHSFGTPMVVHAPQTKLLIEQRQVIEEIAKQGRDCVIVGRNADVILNDLNPFNIFVCAEMDAKIKRCRERADHDEQLSDKALKKNIQRIDKNRARTRFLIADGEWGHRKAYHLIVNTTDWDLGELAHSVADMVKRWAKQQTKE
ncbi:MAG: cytidylate kinase-like family protein [Clostridiales bacterium]|nr:cytidylate kinase-like family protein [Clostridiales bacterium]